MKQTILRLGVLSLLLALPLGANAMMNEGDAYATVQSMLGSASLPVSIISTLKDDGRTRPEATVFAMVSGGEDNRVAFAIAGVESSTSLMEAQLVTQAVLAAAGETGPVADAVREAMHAYSKTLRPPTTFDGGRIANGSGVSPSN